MKAKAKPRTNYVVKLGPGEADEYHAFEPEEMADGSLRWIDSAGIPHVAQPGSWTKETRQ
jgi:hypothetical protein